MTRFRYYGLFVVLMVVALLVGLCWPRPPLVIDPIPVTGVPPTLTATPTKAATSTPGITPTSTESPTRSPTATRTATTTRIPTEVPGIVCSDMIYPNSIYHVVEQDTLWHITGCAFGFDVAYGWPILWRYNPQLGDPHHIHPGNQVLIPSFQVFMDALSEEP